MATATSSTAPRRPGRSSSSLEAQAERLFEPLLYVAIGIIALAAALPLLVVALPVCGGLWWLRTRPWWLKGSLGISCALPALVALLGAYVTRGRDPVDVALGYVDLQFGAGAMLVRAWQGGPGADWWGYALAILPYALCGGIFLGGVAGFLLSGGCFGGTRGKALHLVSADELARHQGTSTEPQPVHGLLARGRLTAITALPKQGKTYAWFGLLRARQTGKGWFGRRCVPGKTVVMTEEDRGTFSGKVKRFGINGRTLVTFHAPEVDDSRFGPDQWATLIDEAARKGRRAGCDTLCIDTLTTWAPWAFRGPEHMSTCLRTVKQALVRYRLAGGVILHNRKQQTDLGAIVDMLGTIAGSAAYDVVAGFHREKQTGECTLKVDGRLGEWGCTALLQGGVYRPVRQWAGAEDSTEQAADATAAESSKAAPAVPPTVQLEGHLRQTLTQLREAGPLTTEGVAAALGIKVPAATDRLKALERKGVVTRTGRGVKGDPHTWEARAPGDAQVDTTATARVSPLAVRDDPAYMAYLKSAEWIVKRTQVLHRAGGQCEQCHGAEAVEVHHLTYERLGDERPSDLLALCAPCHRVAHHDATMSSPQSSPDSP